MMSISPFSALAESVSPSVIQGFVLAMLALIVIGTVVQMIHHKNVTYFFNKKLGKIINKDILIKTLSEYNEILLVGSGKGVVSIKNINEINWKRKSLKFYKMLSSFYKNEVNKCSLYK